MISQQTLPDRLYSLDVSRGVAALIVVIFHWRHFYYSEDGLPAGFEVEQQPFFEPLKLVYVNGGHAAVSFFFSLSGFVFFWIYKEKVASGECKGRLFLLNRFARIYPLHLITLLVVAALQFFFFRLHEHFFVYEWNDFYHFMLHLGLASNWGLENGYSYNAPVWSVSIEVGLYALFFLLARKTWFRGITISFPIMVAILLHVSVGIGSWALGIIGFFTGGITLEVLKWYLSRRRLWIDCLVFAGFIVTILALVICPELANFLFKRTPLYLVTVFPLIIFSLVLFETRFTLPLKPFRWIGDITYSSYLLHFPLQLLLVLFFSALGQSQEIFNNPWVFGLFFAILIPLSLLTYKKVEMPLQRWIRAAFS